MLGIHPLMAATKGSMKCLLCPGGTHVLDSRYTKGLEAQRRRRKCDRCGHRFTTYELPVTQYRAILTMRQHALALTQALAILAED